MQEKCNYLTAVSDILLHGLWFTVPMLSSIGSPKVLLEHMSFIHQYDSRKLQDQPYQGRVRFIQFLSRVIFAAFYPMQLSFNKVLFLETHRAGFQDTD